MTVLCPIRAAWIARAVPQAPPPRTPTVVRSGLPSEPFGGDDMLLLRFLGTGRDGKVALGLDATFTRVGNLVEERRAAWSPRRCFSRGRPGCPLRPRPCALTSLPPPPPFAPPSHPSHRGSEEGNRRVTTVLRPRPYDGCRPRAPLGRRGEDHGERGRSASRPRGFPPAPPALDTLAGPGLGVITALSRPRSVGVVRLPPASSATARCPWPPSSPRHPSLLLPGS